MEIEVSSRQGPSYYLCWMYSACPHGKICCYKVITDATEDVESIGSFILICHSLQWRPCGRHELLMPLFRLTKRLSPSFGFLVRRRYTVWSGTLVNKGEELFQISIRSSNLPLLPFRLWVPVQRTHANTHTHTHNPPSKRPCLWFWLFSWLAILKKADETYRQILSTAFKIIIYPFVLGPTNWTSAQRCN